jgi:hypothetical protein
MLRRSSALLAALVLAMAACGDDPDEGSSASNDADGHAERQEAAAPAKPTPESCLESAGLDPVEKRTPTFWRGFHGQGYLIRVERFASRREAKEAVQLATVVAAAQAGPFGVFGPIKDRDDGSTGAVARCLRG